MTSSGPGRWGRIGALARDQRAPGVLLTLATVAALAWANVDGNAYRHVWHATVAVPGVRLSLRDWVNQGLMVLFFVVVGIEMRREIGGGELRSWQHASVPVGAALGGMALPAVIYAAVIHGGAGARGWGIPMATDVAFGLGALALVAPRASTRTRVFLLGLAVADDIASIVVLVCFYSSDVRWWSVVGALACVVLMIGVGQTPVRLSAVVIALGAIAWWALVHAGVEASVVGIAVGMVAPGGARSSGAARRAARRRVRSWEHALEPWVTVVVLPVFALANTGVAFARSGIWSGDALVVLVAVLVARTVGKPLGIVGSARLITMRRGADHAGHLPLRARAGVGAIAAVGFTVPLLIIRVALPDGPLEAAATTGLLVSSVLGFVIGGLVFARSPASSSAPIPG